MFNIFLTHCNACNTTYMDLLVKLHLTFLQN